MRALLLTALATISTSHTLGSEVLDDIAHAALPSGLSPRLPSSWTDLTEETANAAAKANLRKLVDVFGTPEDYLDAIVARSADQYLRYSKTSLGRVALAMTWWPGAHLVAATVLGASVKGSEKLAARLARVPA